MSREAWMPAMPAPMTSARLVRGMPMGSSGSLRLVFSTMERMISAAFSVALSLSCWCTQEHCSRMLAISHWYGFSPASSVAERKVDSCMRGEQAAMTTPSSPFSAMASRISFCPGSEHRYL